MLEGYKNLTMKLTLQKEKLYKIIHMIIYKALRLIT